MVYFCFLTGNTHGCIFSIADDREFRLVLASGAVLIMPRWKFADANLCFVYCVPAEGCLPEQGGETRQVAEIGLAGGQRFFGFAWAGIFFMMEDTWKSDLVFSTMRNVRWPSGSTGHFCPRNPGSIPVLAMCFL